MHEVIKFTPYNRVSDCYYLTQCHVAPNKELQQVLA